MKSDPKKYSRAAIGNFLGVACASFFKRIWWAPQKVNILFKVNKAKIQFPVV